MYCWWPATYSFGFLFSFLKFFLSVVVYMGLHQPANLQTVAIYFALTSKKVLLLIKSIQMNAKLHLRAKSVMSIGLLEKLSKMLTKFHNGVTYRAIFLIAYFCFLDRLLWFQILSKLLIKLDIQFWGM